MIVYAVDDERPALVLLKNAIKKAMPGVEPLCFESPVDLLAEAKQAAPDLVFSDIDMPIMNGLELAEELTKLKGEMKIFFLTGYGQYAMDVFDVYASGYIMKPCDAEKIGQALSGMHTPRGGKEIVIRTFGNFDVAYRGKSIRFRSVKSKEMLAYLVDRNGVFIPRQEMGGVLFEDNYSRTMQSHLSHIATKLDADLTEVGIHNFFFRKNGYALDMSLADCDLTDFLNGKKVSYFGEYMEQFSWGEYRKDELEKLKDERKKSK